MSIEMCVHVQQGLPDPGVGAILCVSKKGYLQAFFTQVRFKLLCVLHQTSCSNVRPYACMCRHVYRSGSPLPPMEGNIIQEDEMYRRGSSLTGEGERTKEDEVI